jgi:hypothetical protein
MNRTLHEHPPFGGSRSCFESNDWSAPLPGRVSFGNSQVLTVVQTGISSLCPIPQNGWRLTTLGPPTEARRLDETCQNHPLRRRAAIPESARRGQGWQAWSCSVWRSLSLSRKIPTRCRSSFSVRAATSLWPLLYWSLPSPGLWWYSVSASPALPNFGFQPDDAGEVRRKPK